MIQAVPIKCPKCNKMVGSLSFWKKIGDEYYHLCEECLNTPFSDEAYLRIGVYYGRKMAREEIRNFFIEEI